MQHFKDNHFRTDSGRFTVPLINVKVLGESRSQAVRRFLALERFLHSKGQFEEFTTVIEEYLEMGHAELVPVADLEKSPQHVF